VVSSPAASFNLGQHGQATYLDYRGYLYPTQVQSIRVQQVSKFAHFLWKHDPLFQQAIHKIISYFLTELEYYDPTYQGELEDEDIRGYREVLEKQLNLKAVLHQVLLNFCVYGNVIVGLLPPLRRTLQCPSCGIIHPIGVLTAPENTAFKFKYHVRNVQFEATCSVCNSRGSWRVHDVKDDFIRQARISLYDMRQFTIQCDPFTDKRVYTWQIPAWIKRNITNGDGLTLESAPMSVLRAISKDKSYTFNSNVLLHLREPDLVGMQTGGWGVAQALYCYGTSRYNFGLRKMNEVLTCDYLAPLRVMSPAQAKNTGQTIGTNNVAMINDMADPASVV